MAKVSIREINDSREKTKSENSINRERKTLPTFLPIAGNNQGGKSFGVLTFNPVSRTAAIARMQARIRA